MTLKEHIDDIRDKLEKGVFPPNESAVSQGIVLRLLNALDWPTFNTQVVHPEYPVEGGRVDFALCHPESTPRIFIEVKQVGNIEGAEKQLFQYAFHRGVSIAILTDGREWHFFHPTGQGEYRERKVHEIDLTKGNSEESAKRLNKYLHYNSVCTGEAVREIEKDYKSVSQQREIEARLPEVWGELVNEKNEDLILAMMDKAKNKIGYELTEEQVLNFLRKLSIEPSLPTKMNISAKTGVLTHKRKRRINEDGSAEWVAAGKSRQASAAIVSEMRRAAQDASARGEDKLVKFAMAIAVKYGIVEDTNADKNSNWAAVGKIIGYL